MLNVEAGMASEFSLCKLNKWVCATIYPEIVKDI
jgi:hypothetical protein